MSASTLDNEAVHADQHRVLHACLENLARARDEAAVGKRSWDVHTEDCMLSSFLANVVVYGTPKVPAEKLRPPQPASLAARLDLLCGALAEACRAVQVHFQRPTDEESPPAQDAVAAPLSPYTDLVESLLALSYCVARMMEVLEETGKPPGASAFVHRLKAFRDAWRQAAHAVP